MVQIGKYEVLEEVASGGFGTVYRAFDPSLNRQVAIKTCIANDESLVQRFRKEAQILGSFHHRNITMVHEFGVHEGTPYLVQELLSGEDLAERIRHGGAVSLEERLGYLVQIAQGLAAAHDQGVVHRDIKPANIRVLEDGTIKIMDFGLARLVDQKTRLTQAGLILGTAHYLAPEQVMDAPIDGRTDIFAFGILMFELLTSEPPFPGPRLADVLGQVLRLPHRPIRELWAGCPPEVEEIVDRCLAKRPEERFQSCHEVLDRLERFLDSRASRSLHRTWDRGSSGPEPQPAEHRLGESGQRPDGPAADTRATAKTMLLSSATRETTGSGPGLGDPPGRILGRSEIPRASPPEQRSRGVPRTEERPSRRSAEEARLDELPSVSRTSIRGIRLPEPTPPELASRAPAAPLPLGSAVGAPIRSPCPDQAAIDDFVFQRTPRAHVPRQGRYPPGPQRDAPARLLVGFGVVALWLIAVALGVWWLVNRSGDIAFFSSLREAFTGAAEEQPGATGGVPSGDEAGATSDDPIGGVEVQGLESAGPPSERPTTSVAPTPPSNAASAPEGTGAAGDS